MASPATGAFGPGRSTGEFVAARPRESSDSYAAAAVLSGNMDVKYDVSSYRRVLELASTPSWDEFSQVALIAGAGIVLIGILGFVMFATMTVIPGA